MSTRCRIGIENEDKTITSIYCHHDGYLAGVGATLLDHYKDKEKIYALMKLGDMSSLGIEPIEKIDRIHSEEACDIYSTQEEKYPAKTRSLEQTIERFKHSDQEFLYIFKDGKWIYMKWNSPDFEELRK